MPPTPARTCTLATSLGASRNFFPCHKRVDMGLEATRITTPWKLLIMASVVVVMESASLASSSDLLASVQIVNLLPDQLQLHCKASERDLHPQVLPGNVAARFWWDFYPKIWFGRTVYYCNFKGAATSKWQYFVVWTEGWFIFGARLRAGWKSPSLGQ